jgi:hypothetical protein
MERKYRVIFVINLIFIFTIIGIPSFLIFAEFGNFNRIDKSLAYTYSSPTPPIKKKLNLNLDVGTINIKYTTLPVDYLIRIDVEIEMAGPNLNGKSYIDFFNIGWENSTSPVNFTLELVSNMLEDFSTLHEVNININVKLRADSIFDINASTVNGKIEFTNLMGISISNLFLNVDRGNIVYEAKNCTIGGNITGIVNYGNITIKSHNNQYLQNSEFTIRNLRGYILIDIYQYKEMGANITGTVITETGTIRLNYKDDSANIGARFVFYNKTTFGSETETIWVGFDDVQLPLGAGLLFVSHDFPTKNNYYFSLNKFYTSGEFLWNLDSHPVTH